MTRAATVEVPFAKNAVSAAGTMVGVGVAGGVAPNTPTGLSSAMTGNASPVATGATYSAMVATSRCTACYEILKIAKQIQNTVNTVN